LYALHTEAVARSRALVATITGRPGVGRRRLAGHFVRWLADEHGGNIGRGSAGTEPEQGSYAVLGAALRAANSPTLPDPGAGEDGPPATEPAPCAGRDALKAAATLLQTSADEGTPPAEVAIELAALLHASSEAAPVHLVLDGLDRADDHTLALLTALAPLLRAPSVTIVCTARPELSERQPWQPASVRSPGVEVLELQPLTLGETEALLERLLDGVAGVPPNLACTVFEQSAGMPGRVVQFVRNLMAESVITADGEAWRFQPSRFDLQALDRRADTGAEGAETRTLLDSERELLHCAAAMGQIAWAEGVALLVRARRRGQATRSLWDGTPLLAGVRERLQSLVAQGVLAPGDEPSLPGAEVYTFTSPEQRAELVAELPDAEVRRGHALLAEWLSNNRPERPSAERVELEARHWDRAGASLQAARGYAAAARLCREALDVDRARSLWAVALRLCGERNLLLRMEVLHALGGAAATAGDADEALRLFNEMLELAWLMDHKAKGGAAYNRIGRLHRERGNLDRALDCVMTAWGLFESAGDAQGVAACIDDVGQLHRERGHLSEALERFEQALKRRRAMGDQRSIALSLHNIGSVHMQLGRPEAALRTLRRALELRKQLGEIADVMSSLATIGRVLRDLERGEEARDVWEEGLTLAQGSGNLHAEAQFRTLLGAQELARGAAGEARELLAQATDLAARLGDTRLLAEGHTHLAAAVARVSGTKDAVVIAEQASAYARETANPSLLAAALRVQAELAVERGRLEQALDLLGQAVRGLSGAGDQAELARVLQARAALLNLVGQADAAAADRRWIEDLQAPEEGPTRTEGGLTFVGKL